MQHFAIVLGHFVLTLESCQDWLECFCLWPKGLFACFRLEWEWSGVGVGVAGSVSVRTIAVRSL